MVLTMFGLVWRETLVQLPLLLARSLLAILVIGSRALVLAAALGNLVHAVVLARLGQQPHAPIAKVAPPLDGLLELLEPRNHGIEALGVGDQGIRRGLVDEIIVADVLEYLNLKLEIFDVDSVDGGQGGRWRHRARRRVPAALADGASALLACAFLAGRWRHVGCDRRSANSMTYVVDKAQRRAISVCAKEQGQSRKQAA